MGDFDFTGSPSGSSRISSAMRAQGFEEPTDRSPFRNPPGWHDGSVHQTGGHVMVRRWFTNPEMNRVRDKRPGRKYEYEIGYGSNPGVSIQRFEWQDDQYRDGSGSYVFDGVVEERGVSQNTDEAKARAARELMRKHSDKTR